MCAAPQRCVIRCLVCACVRVCVCDPLVPAPLASHTQVTEWLQDREQLEKMSAAASAIGETHAKATKAIAREIAELVSL